MVLTRTRTRNIMNTLLEQTQEIHYQLDALNGLFAAVQEKVLQEPFRKYSEFAEEMFTKAKEALEKEAVRLDGLLQQGLRDSVSESTESTEPNNYKQYVDVLTCLLTPLKEWCTYRNLVLAIKNNLVPCVQLLLQPLDGHPDPSAENNVAIFWASRSGNAEIVRLLLKDRRVDPSARNNSAILYASANGYIDMFRLLLADPRVDPSAEHNSAIRTASQNGHTEIVRLLLADPRVDPSACDNAAITDACRIGHTEVVCLLLQDPRVNPAEYRNVAIRHASSNGHADVVCLLLQDPRVDPAAEDNEAIR
ncbi:hypothetical protein EBU99_14625, partial [bacterium]|nr:hypothetical protein [bacterium]